MVSGGGAPARARRARRKLGLAVQYAVTPELTPTPTRFRKWVAAALQGSVDLTVRVVGKKEGRSLNRDYRGRDYATNVLTFSYEKGPRGVCGDIVLCAPIVAREAKQQKKPVLAHYAHLTVHGVLHLQGYDHENNADAEIMESLERAILARLGYPDPYRSAH